MVTDETRRKRSSLFPHLSRRVPLDSLRPDAAFAEHNTTTPPENRHATRLNKLSYVETCVHAQTRTSDDGRGDDAGLE